MEDISVTALHQVLRTTRLGRTACFYPRAGSTNDIALEMARGGAADGLLVYTDEQTAGRGRLDRSWWAPPRSCLLMSLVLAAPLPLPRAGQLTMCLGLGAVEAVEAVTGIRAALKWPNDLVFGGRKLGGMLSELVADGDRLAYAVLGLGLNVNITDGDGPDSLPAGLRATATSLRIIAGAAIDRLALIAELLARTETWYDRVRAGETVHAAWQERLDTLGRRVRVTGAGADLEGVAAGVTPEGGLILRTDDGNRHTVWSGDVLSLRAA